MAVGRRVIGAAVLSACLVCPSSCSRKVLVDGMLYKNPEQALAASRNESRIVLSRVTPTKTPVGGSAVFVLPSDDHIKNNLVRFVGDGPPDYFVEFVVALRAQALRSHAEALERRRVFDRLTVVTSDAAESFPSGEDFAVIVLKDGDGKYAHFIRRRGSDVARQVDPGPESLPPVSRMKLWLENVEKAARSF